MSDNTIDNEIWKDVPGYEGLYRVSNRGGLQGYFQGKWRTRKTYAANHGYIRCSLTKNGIRISQPIHRIVLLAFAGKPPKPDMQCNHKNGIKNDNRLENLEWVTISENIQHSYDVIGRGHPNNSGERNGSTTKLTTDQVLEIRRLHKGGVRVGVLATLYGVKHSTISDIVRRKNWKHI